MAKNNISNNEIRVPQEDKAAFVEEAVVSAIGGKLGEETLSWFRNRNGDTLQGALAFVPWVLQQAYFDGHLVEKNTVVHRGKGAVAFVDAVGFTELTAKLTSQSNGAEQLSACLGNFFTPLIGLINDYHGDVVKFSGNALTVYFPDVDDTKSPKYNRIVPPHGTYGLPDLGPMATAVLRASACSIEIHKRLHEYETGVDDHTLSLHIGIGCGQVNILQVGGMEPPETHVPRFEYFIAGPPLEQISIAAPLAQVGETCLSPQAWEFVKDCVIEGSPLEDRPDFHLLLRMDESKYTFPTIKHAAKDNDDRGAKQFTLSQLNVIRQYIPSAVFKQIECGTLTYVNEMRHISAVYISGTGLDVMSDKGPEKCQELVSSVQRACYAHEGTLNKFLLNEKGMLFLLVFGLPPLVHTDDPTRAVLACFDMQTVFKRLELVGRFGVTTSQSYCGVSGSNRRMEYTVLGHHVNLAQHFCYNAPKQCILCDEDTKDRVSAEVVMNALAPMKIGNDPELLTCYMPVRKESPYQIGVTNEGRIRFPWYDNPFGGVGGGGMMTNVQQLCSVKGWPGITKVQTMLGGEFTKEVHEQEQFLTQQMQVSKPPGGSPFDKGGVIILSSATGLGKVELAEHLAVSSACKFGIYPIFGVMGPRPDDSQRLATELIRTTLSIYRFLDTSLPTDDVMALTKVMPKECQEHLALMKMVLTGDNVKEKSKDFLEKALDVVVGLVSVLSKNTSINIIVQLETGTTLFPKTSDADQKVFWKTVTRLHNAVKKAKGGAGKPLILTVLTQDSQAGNPAVQDANSHGTMLQLAGLTDDAIVEYLSNYLTVPDTFVPGPLRTFISKVSLGNPLFIRETIDQMQEEQHVAVNKAANGQPKSVEVKDLDKCNIAGWQHTSMVGGTVCLIESLEPLESAVLKMSTCFAGPFALPDLAASRASVWGDTTHFDFLRLYQSLKKLVTKDCVDLVDAPTADEGTNMGNTQFFQTRNLVIRAIAYSMVLEQQRKSVKRQALVDRALKRFLPARMEVLAVKKNAQHIPWYYEQAFRRM